MIVLLVIIWRGDKGESQQRQFTYMHIAIIHALASVPLPPRGGANKWQKVLTF